MVKDGVTAEAEDRILFICVQGMEENCASTTDKSWWYFDLEEGLDARVLALSDS